MSTCKRFAGAVLIDILFVFACSAQSTAPEQPAQTLSLERAIQIAVSPQGSTAVQLARESVQLAHSRSAQARAELLPNLEGSVAEQNQTVNLRALGLNFQISPAFSFPTSVGPFNTFDARLRLNQEILNLGAIRRLQTAHKDEQVAEDESATVRDRIACAVAKQYAAVLRSEASVETAKSDALLAEALRDLATHRESVGEGDEIDITRAKLTVARDQQRLLAAETENTRANLDLINVLNLDWDTKVLLTGKLGDTPYETWTPEQALEVAFKSRAEFKTQLNRIDSARLTYSAAKLERMPSIVGFGDYGDLSGVQTHTAGLALRLPIFDGGRIESQRSQALTLVREEQIRERELRNQVELEVRQGLATLAAAKSQVQVAEQAVSLAEDELARARRRYEAGITNSLEVVNAETQLENARDERVVALFKYTEAHIDLAQAMGTIKTISF